MGVLAAMEDYSPMADVPVEIQARMDNAMGTISYSLLALSIRFALFTAEVEKLLLAESKPREIR